MENSQQTVPSPCIRNCCLNEEDVCLGCFRSLDEIVQWGLADDEARRHILLKSSLRKKIFRDKHCNNSNSRDK